MPDYPENDAWCECPPCTAYDIFFLYPYRIITCEGGTWWADARNDTAIPDVYIQDGYRRIDCSPKAAVGTSSISLWGEGGRPTGLTGETVTALFRFEREGHSVPFNMEHAFSLTFQLSVDEAAPGHMQDTVLVILTDVAGRTANKDLTLLPPASFWTGFNITVGSESIDWVKDADFDWTQVATIRFVFREQPYESLGMIYPGKGYGFIDGLHLVMKLAYLILWIDADPYVEGIPWTIDGRAGQIGSPPYLPQDVGTPITLSITTTHASLTFDHWEDSVHGPWPKGENTISFTMWKDRTVTAVFSGVPPDEKPPPPEEWYPGYYIQEFIRRIRERLQELRA